MTNSATDISTFPEDLLETATQLVADLRSRCIQLGLSPQQFAELLLPEALLAMMVAGMPKEDAEAAFERFTREEISAWYLQVKRTAGYCDCEREAFGEHELFCGRSFSAPLADSIIEGATRIRSRRVRAG